MDPAGVRARLGALGFARLHVGVLRANLRARAFYAAMGAEEIGQRTFDEEGHLLPECVYEWSGLRELGLHPERVSRPYAGEGEDRGDTRLSRSATWEP